MSETIGHEVPSSSYPKDKLGKTIAPDTIVAVAVHTGGKSLTIGKVVRVEGVQRMRWVQGGQQPYTAWEVWVSGRRHNWRDDTYDWGPQRMMLWQDMVVLNETIDTVERDYSAKHNA